MPLTDRIKPHHTINAFRAAAKARFREAQLLASQGPAYRLASIYLFGYSAEMLLKAAYFRLQGWAANQAITVSHMQSAKNHAQQSLLITWSGNLHNLEGWKDLLIHERQRLGHAYPRSYWRTLNAWIRRVAVNWSESLRYHDCRPYQGELAVCYQGVSWLIGQFRFL